MSSNKKMKARMNSDINGETSSFQTRKNKTDYDSAWKEVIEGLFEPFTGFFFPDIHQDIDFSKGIEILDSELRTGAFKVYRLAHPFTGGANRTID